MNGAGRGPSRSWVSVVLVVAACARSTGATSSNAGASVASPNSPAASTPPAEPGPYEGDYYDGPRCVSPAHVEGAKGDPAKVGCADGQRELFADASLAPDIAGCRGEWSGGKSLRDAPTGKACGDDLGECAVPADVCAPGWHVCGADGRPRDLRDRVTAEQCAEAGPGRFVAALSLVIFEEDTICPGDPDTVVSCAEAGLGSEPVCCGDECRSGECRDTVWPGQTRGSMGTAEGCGYVTSECHGGVLCCSSSASSPTG